MLQRSYNLLCETSSRHQVTLVAFNQKALLSDQRQIEEAFEVLSGFCKQVEIIEILSDRNKWLWWKLVIKSLFTLDPYAVNWLKSPRMRDVLRQVLISEKFDLVHIDTIGLIPYVSLFKNVPKVLNHHNIESDMMRSRAKKEKNVFNKLYFYQEAVKLKRIEKRFCSRFSQNLVVSTLDKNRIKSLVSNISVSLVPNGVDISYFKPVDRSPIAESLVMVGGMSWYPNRDGALYFFKEIWPRIIARFPKVKISVIGRKPPSQLVELARKDSRISLLGFVDDIRPDMHDAAVYVCAIQDGGGTRLKILDAMAMGKAIVCTSVACEGIDVVRNKNLLIADDPGDFAGHIADLFGNPARRSQLEKEARALVLERYDWKKIGVELMNAYDFAVTKGVGNVSTNKLSRGFLSK
ncbi:MAG: glycosyltransferase family 4 protein [Nitrospiria bacterium]